MKKQILIYIPFVLILTLTLAYSQEPKTEELKAEVPELTAYHKVIYKLWHVLWPGKNVKGIAEIYPDILSGAENLKMAKLPGILRDKEKIWKENVDKLINIVNDLKTAIDNNDSVQILKKSEELHSQYEKLVRIIKPVTKELDEFHQVLYVLYHYYVPEYNIEKIKSTAPELKQKMEALKKSKLPERLKAKEKEFQNAIIKLEKEVDNFVKLSSGKFDRETITSSLNRVHTAYQKVEKIFD